MLVAPLLSLLVGVEVRRVEMAGREAPRAAVARALPGIELAEVESLPTADGRVVVRFEQRHRGLPVVHRGATVVRRGAEALVASRVEVDLPRDVSPLVPAERAAAIAGVGAEDVGLAVFPFAGGARLVWLAYAGMNAAARAPAVVVDAGSGEPLLRFDALVYERDARVFAMNPVVTPELVTVKLESLAMGAMTLRDARISALNCIDLKTTSRSMGYEVHACQHRQRAAADANGDFLLDSPGDDAAEDPFAEVSAFYHLTKAHDYLTRIGMPDLETRPLPAIVNLRISRGLLGGFDEGDATNTNLPLQPFDNAFFAAWDPFFSHLFGVKGDALFFGQGTQSDFAYDGDVVYHELGHAMVGRTARLVRTWHLDAQGAIDAPGAMNEALADYFSSAITGDGRVGEYAGKAFGGAIRDLDGPHSCPDVLWGEVHADSQAFSSALWSARKQAGADAGAFDAAVMAALLATPSGDAGFGDLAHVLDATLGMSPAAHLSATLQNSLSERGFEPDCRRVIEHTGGTLRRDLFAPGRNLAPVAPDAPYVPGLVQVHLTFPAGTKSLQIGWTDVGLGWFEEPDDTLYAPGLLARFGAEPITFSYSPRFQATADVFVASDGPLGEHAARFAVPRGATEAYAMIVNRGDVEAVYSDITVQLNVPVPGVSPSVPRGETKDEEREECDSSLCEDRGCKCSSSAARQPAPAPFAPACTIVLIFLCARRAGRGAAGRSAA